MKKLLPLLLMVVAVCLSIPCTVMASYSPPTSNVVSVRIQGVIATRTYYENGHWYRWNKYEDGHEETILLV